MLPTCGHCSVMTVPLYRSTVLLLVGGGASGGLLPQMRVLQRLDRNLAADVLSKSNRLLLVGVWVSGGLLSQMLCHCISWCIIG